MTISWFKPSTRSQSGALAVTAILFAVISYNLYYCCQIKQRELEERQVEMVRLQAEISIAEFNNAQLKAQVAHLGTDAGAEEIAREKLGLVKPGEVSFVVLGAENVAQAPLKADLPAQSPEPGLVMRFMHWFFLG